MEGKTLTAFFSRAGENYFGGKLIRIDVGNTEKAVDFIKDAVDTDVFKIEMVNTYSDDYKKCVEQSRDDLKANARPQMLNNLESVEEYDNIILAFPNYCGTMPMVVFTFLEKYDFSGKNILPLCTNEGSGMGRSIADIMSICPSANIKNGLSVSGSNVQGSKHQIEQWLINS